MAFGIKINIGVDPASAKNLSQEIQNAVNKAVSDKPVTIQKITLKSIDASPAIKKVQQELQKMLNDMTASGIVANGGAARGSSVGTEAAKRQMRELKQVTAETAAAMQELKNIQSQVNSAYKGAGKLGDTAEASQIVSAYREIQVEIERTRKLEGSEKEAAVRSLAERASALQHAVASQKEFEKAAASAANASQKEVDISGRVISMRQSIQSWTEKNTTAYKENKKAIDEMMTSLQNEQNVDPATLSKASTQFRQIQETSHLAGIEGKTFFQVLSDGASKLSSFISVATIFHKAMSVFKDMVSNVRELDAAMTELRKVTDLTETQYRSFLDTSAAMSREIGSTMSSMVSSTADFARLGYNIEDATALARAALVYKNVGDGISDVSVATEDLISTMKAFGDSIEDPMRMVDMFNEVGNNFAISSSGIGEALRRSAAALSAAGNTIEESIGIVTAMNAVVQNPEQVGTAAKTLTLYLRAAKTEAEAAGIETDGMADSVSKLRAEILALTNNKVDIMIDDDTFKSTYQIMKEIAGVWDDLTDVTQANLTNLIGGKRNANVISSLVRNFQDAEDAANAASQSMGSALAENEKYLDSIAGKISVFQATFEDLSRNIIDSDVVKAVVDMGTALLSMLNTLAQIKLLAPSLMALIIAMQTMKSRSEVTSLVESFEHVVYMGQSSADVMAMLTARSAQFTSMQKGMLSGLLQSSPAWNSFAGGAEQSADAIVKLGTSASGATGRLQGLRSAFEGMSLVGKVSLAGTAIMTVISIISAVRDHIQRVHDEAIQAADDIVNAYDQSKSNYETNIQALNQLKAEYNILSVGVDENGKNASLTTEEYQRYLSVVQQIVDISPSVVKGFDNEGQKLINYTSLIKDATEEQIKLQKAQRDTYLAGGDELFSGTNKRYKDLHKQESSIAESIRYSMFALAPNIALENEATFNQYRPLVDFLNQFGITLDHFDNDINAHIRDIYENSNDFVVALRATGEYREDEIESMVDELRGLASVYQEMDAELSDRANYLAEWSRDKDWFALIPDNALESYYSGIQNVINLEDDLDTLKERVGEFGQAMADAFNSPYPDDDIKMIGAFIDQYKAGEMTLEDLQSKFDTFKGIADAIYGPDVAQAVVSYFQGIIDGIVGVETAAESATTTVENYTQAINGLVDSYAAFKKGNDILAKANTDMESGSLSPDTINAIASALSDSESITDYISNENGVLALNVEKWNERNAAMMNADISAYQQQLLSLMTQRDIANAEGDTARQNALDGEISQLQEIVSIYEYLMREESEMPDLSLSSMFGDIDKAKSDADGLVKAYQQTLDGVALTNEEWARLAGSNADMFGYFNAYTDSVEDQANVLSEVLESRSRVVSDAMREYIASLENAINTGEYGTSNQRMTTIALTMAKNMLADWESSGGLLQQKVEEEADSFSLLSDAISAVNKASSLLTSIQSGNGDVMNMLSSASDMAKATGQSISDFFSYENGEFVWDTEAVKQWAYTYIDSLEGVEGMSVDARNAIKELVTAELESTEELEVGLNGISDAYERLKKGRDLAATASEDMKNGGLSADTIQSMVALLTEGESITDYLTTENGILALNTEAWNRRSAALLNADVSAYQKQYADLLGQRDVAIADGDKGRQRQIESEIEAIQKYIDIYELLLAEEPTTVDLSISTLFGDIDKAKSDSDELVQAYRKALDGVALTNEEWARLAGSNTDLYGYFNAYSDSAEDQAGAIAGALEARSRVVADAMKAYIAQLDKAFQDNNFENADQQRAASNNLRMAKQMLDDWESSGGLLAQDVEEEADAFEQLNNAISAVNKSASLLTKIESGNGSVMDTLSSVAEIAKDAGKDLSDFASFEGGQWSFNTDAIKQWAYSYIDSLEGMEGMSDEAREALKQLVVAEVEATTTAEHMSNAYDKATKAVSGMGGAASGAELTFKSYQELIDIDARYATAVEYQNGILTLNQERYNEVTAAIAEETVAMARAQEQVILTSDEYQDLTSRIGNLSNEEQKRLDDLNAEAMGYRVLASEIENTQTAYAAFMRSSGDANTEGFSAAQKAFQVIQDTLYNSDSDIYGMMNRDQYKEAWKFLISPEIELDSEEFKTQWDAISRYLTDSQQGIQNFIDDLTSSEYYDQATGTITGTIDQLAESLGVSVPLLRELFDQLGQYTEVDVSEGLDNTNDSAGKLEGIFAKAKSAAEEAKTQISEALQRAAEGSQAQTDMETLQSKAAEAEAELTTLTDMVSNLDPGTISLDNSKFMSAAGAVSSALSEILTKLQRINSMSTINLVVNTVANSFSSLYSRVSSLFGRGSASGTSNAAGGKTLVGEIGAETVIDPSANRWYTVGTNGPEFVNLPRGAIVLNASQTAELFNRGRVAGYGQAMAGGSDLVTIRGLSSIKTGKTSTTKSSSSSGSKKTAAAFDKNAAETARQEALDKLLEKYQEADNQLQHLIEHQEFFFNQAERGLDFSAMAAALQQEASLTQQIMNKAQATIKKMLSAGAKDTDKQLQEVEKTYWSAYESLNSIMDQLGSLYIDGLNDKIDGIQEAYSTLTQAVEQFNDHGGVSVDVFQQIANHGLQYLSVLEMMDGQYIINEAAVERLIARETEQLAIEQSLNYVRQLSEALLAGNSSAVANLVNLTNQLSNATWDAVYAQAEMLQNLGLAANQYDIILDNINKMKSLSTKTITNLSYNFSSVSRSSSSTSSSTKVTADYLDKILDLTKQLIKAETEEHIKAIEDEIDQYKKLIDKKKESLKTARDEDSYTKEIAEKTKEIAQLQSRINQLSLDDSREARAERASLEKELAERQSELYETQDDHAYDLQIEALDEMANKYAEVRQVEIDELENSISSEEKLYQLAIDRISNRWDTLYQDLINWNTESGNTLNQEITENWEKALKAAQSYGSFVNAYKAYQGGTFSAPSSGSSGGSSKTSSSSSSSKYASGPYKVVNKSGVIYSTNGNGTIKGGAIGNLSDYDTISVLNYVSSLGMLRAKLGDRYVLISPGDVKKYHSGGIAGDVADMGDKEVMAVLEKGEAVLDKKKKGAMYQLVDFYTELSKRIGSAIQNIGAFRLPQLIPALASASPAISGGGIGGFQPIFNVTVNSNGAMTGEEAGRIGSRIGQSAADELYEAFQKRGIGGFLSSKLK